MERVADLSVRAGLAHIILLSALVMDSTEPMRTLNTRLCAWIYCCAVGKRPNPVVWHATVVHTYSWTYMLIHTYEYLYVLSVRNGISR